MSVSPDSSRYRASSENQKLSNTPIFLYNTNFFLKADKISGEKKEAPLWPYRAGT
jgi:hypothetical protein